MFYHVDSKRLLIIVLTKLLLITNEHFSHAALTGQCNECFASEAACLDEKNFAICVDGTPINVSTPCPTGRVCTANTAICQATAQGAVPVCYEEQCGTCASAQKNFACLDEAIYAICYNGETPDQSSFDYCPLGYVCDLNNPQICSSAQTVNPSCPIADTTTTDATVDTTTDTTSDSTAGTTIDSTTDSTTDATTESTTDTTTDSTTDSTTDTTTDLTTDSTTETTTDTTTDLTTDKTTDSTTDTTTDSTTDTTTDTTTDSTTDKTADSTTDSTTDTTTESTTDTITDSTTDKITETSTASTMDTTTVATTVATTDTTTESTTIATSISTQAPVDANTFCAEMGETGKFRQKGDTTCARYIYCYRLSGQYLGYTYTCQYYFNAATQVCQTVRPNDC